MAQFEFASCVVFDTEKPPEKQSEVARALVNTTCPLTFNLLQEGCCTSYECWSCWYKALEQGVKHGCKSVHVRRLD